MYTKEQAVKAIGHEFRLRQFLAMTEELGLEPPWTDADIVAIKAARVWIASHAAKMVKLKVAPFLKEAAALGLSEPWTIEKIHVVRDKLTKPFPNLTSKQVGDLLQVSDEWVRRYSNKLNVGKFVKGGCYMVDGVRERRPRRSKSFTEQDVETLERLLKASTRSVSVETPISLYADAIDTAHAAGPTVSPSDVIVGWAERGKDVVPA